MIISSKNWKYPIFGYLHSNVLKSISKKCLGVLTCMILDECRYRTSATISCSQLVATPLSFQAKTHFLCGNMEATKSFFWAEAAANSGRSTVYKRL